MADAPQNADPFKKVIALWIPRRFISPEWVELKAFIDDANDKITQRGFVHYDFQILTTPIRELIPDGRLTIPKPIDGLYLSALTIRRGVEVICEVVDGEIPLWEVPLRREWGSAQTDYFGLANPYQMDEDRDSYTSCHFMMALPAPYLNDHELIAALLHGEKDRRYFYCRCHNAEVVYTTRHRLVCMRCGATHAVFRHPIAVRPQRLLTAREWVALFDESGPHRDDEVEITLLDFCDVEHSDTIWITDQWEEAAADFVFFARSSPEEIETSIRGTEMDPTIFLEAGWEPVEMPPPPAHQVAPDAVDVDLFENAGTALQDGIAWFLKGRKDSSHLVNAVPHLFRGVELLLKARLAAKDHSALAGHPNNPTVLKRLATRGVIVSQADLNTIDQLRRLRNDLQHGTATLGHREGLSLCRKTLILLDRFCHRELGIWLGAVARREDWQALLEIPELAATADVVSFSIVADASGKDGAEVSRCQSCGRMTMLRPHPVRGASCVRCGYVPVVKDDPSC